MSIFKRKTRTTVIDRDGAPETVETTTYSTDQVRVPRHRDNGVVETTVVRERVAPRKPPLPLMALNDRVIAVARAMVAAQGYDPDEELQGDEYAFENARVRGAGQNARYYAPRWQMLAGVARAHVAAYDTLQAQTRGVVDTRAMAEERSFQTQGYARPIGQTVERTTTTTTTQPGYRYAA